MKSLNKIFHLKGFLILIFLGVFSQFSYAQLTFCEGQVITSSSTFSLCDYNPWVLVFSDDFDDNLFDTSYWSAQIGVPRDPTFEKQKAWHLAENVVENSNCLKIVSKNEPVYNKPVVTNWSPYTVQYENFAYTTGEVWSNYRFGYGKYEARIKIPKGKGFWPAFWLWTDDPKYNENDIFEFMNNNTTTHHMTTHFDFYGNGNHPFCTESYTSNDFSEDFHIFTLIWEKNSTQWYVDGILKRIDYKYYNIQGQPYTGCDIYTNHSYILNKIYPNSPMYIIFNTAIENHNYSPDYTTPFPSYLLVDWVRYYQRHPIVNATFDNTNIQIEQDVFNSVAGKNIVIENISIEPNQQIAFIATESISFLPGFHAKKDSKINANIR